MPILFFVRYLTTLSVGGGLILLGELKYLEKNLFSATGKYLGLNLTPHDERPTTNSLSHGVTCSA
jgi:hypothetical protein